MLHLHPTKLSVLSFFYETGHLFHSVVVRIGDKVLRVNWGTVNPM